MTGDSATRIEIDASTRPRGAPPADLAGHEVGRRWMLVEPVGQGSMGCVYRAWDRRTAQLVAVKLIDRGHVVAERFRRAGQILLHLHHPGVLSALAVGKHGPFDYLVTRYCPGTSLADAQRWLWPWSVRTATEITLQLLDALAYVHEWGYVHRDVKPSNVLLDATGAPVLADFDLVKLALPSSSDSGFFSTEALAEAFSDSRPGLSGTPLYLTLERLEGAPATFADDVYAAALILYLLLCGRLPHPGYEFSELGKLVEARRAPVPSPSEVGVELPEALEEVLVHALAPRVEGRFSSCRALHAVLRSALESLESQA